MGILGQKCQLKQGVMSDGLWWSTENALHTSKVAYKAIRNGCPTLESTWCSK